MAQVQRCFVIQEAELLLLMLGLLINCISDVREVEESQ
jgi:hypothetical protein